ncbi:hypothetical protein GUITHDRAFT_162374 [Guillardia theta CCMP2712]|uniref:EF-hand domain-containing protein n=1 Tax=Guillardia theta (strain CCMP2712) TaxID=905079 RepID=L1JJY9_GUITC|nr:hypothetical protein GUITHDRAFT_162374 [Guillardia theta CCMP2712]EKX48469.1 hypothetical protein GUITHDRAFT_162374 [Guillardia theta CCMP2712]|eukprot:XP_005835449.1 hypothetical protein GUITHDRAFT_162374 [Guillardia theta CCMP2712]
MASGAASYLLLLCATTVEALVLSPSPSLSLRSITVSPGSPPSRRTGLTSLRAHADLPSLAQAVQNLNVDSLLLLSADAAGKAKEFKPEYAQESYYATLGLYLISLPGAWSLIKRSVEYKPVNKVYETKGPSAGKEVRQTAAEITAYFRAMNFAPEPSQGTITFRGTMGKSKGQAFFLSFCTFLSLASLALVLTVQFPLVEVSEFSPYWYMTLASPLAGFYYWAKASKDVTVEVKLEESEDGSKCEISTLGSKEELERFCEALNFNEKGKIRVPSLMENLSSLKE